MKSLQAIFLLLVLFLSFGCGTVKEKDKPDLSKIEINEISVHDFRLSALICYIQNIANSNLPRDSKFIKFWIQVEGGQIEDWLYWKGNKLYNQKNEEFNIESKSIYSKVLKESLSVELKSISLDKALTIICSMYYLKYKQDGYNILLIIPQDWSEKVNEDDDEDIEEEL